MSEIHSPYPQPPQPDSSGFFVTRLESALGWARKYSLFSYPFVTACCGMEFMAVSCSHYDTDRFGAALPRFTPRQADLLWVVGTINHKLAPVLVRIYEQMAEPKWVIAFGACASSGGFYDNYATLAGIDKLIPVDMYIPGCPPRPETVLDALMKLQADIHRSRQPISGSHGGAQAHPELPEILGDEIDSRVVPPV
ncbi:MAG: NADH-quinone oxidoreductase subunit NuoB [Deltaproteobacteria bacterium]|nr:NADH-quinone oxidoreductase subunit NuoB [Deltaproteobacteria bacterium]